MHVRSIAGVVAGALVLAACSDSLPTRPDAPELSLNRAGNVAGPKSYIIVADGDALPQGLESAIASNGGTVTGKAPGIGLAFASATSADFAAKTARVKGVRSVLPDVRVQLVPHVELKGSIAEDAGADASATALTETFQAAQWNLVAIHAQDAWSTGNLGEGASVFIVDSGIDCTHPDLAPNVNVSLSVSFVSGETGCVTPGFYFNHGTHVAGIVAAALNGYGVAGVAPRAQLVPVKVIPEQSESGSFGAIIQGILYAADHGADIINMSIGTPPLPRSGFVDDDGNVATARDLSELINAVSRATTYAYQKGSTIIVAAGNDGVDRNHDENGVVIPADLPHVLSIAATGPVGWVVNPGSDLDVPASYTNFGQSRIDFAAPGGNDIFLAANPNVGCNAFGLLVPCGALDFVFSTIAGGWGWAEGTSMAAPHASGIAALIVGKYGHIKPSEVEQHLRDAAVDMGKPGKDPYFGQGFLDAARAVQ
jgi:subtilisin family serine protease